MSKRKVMSFTFFRNYFVDASFISFTSKENKRKIADEFAEIAKRKKINLGDAEIWLDYWNRFVDKWREQNDCD